jgi:hypothetical protein
LNKATIPIIARLQSLETPAHIVGGSARLIADTSNPSPLTMLLREVNETILGRALRFETSGGTSLTLEAAGRRVRHLGKSCASRSRRAVLRARGSVSACPSRFWLTSC